MFKRLNTYIFYYQISFLLIFAVMVFPGCAGNSETQHVNSTKFQELIKSNSGILMDVRTMSEYKNGHIANAGQLNFYSLSFRRKLLMLSKDKPILLYCNTGYRSKKAADYLVENGYSNVYNLEHGIMEWELKEFPVEISPDAQPDLANKMEPEEYKNLLLSNEPVFIDFYAPWCGPCRQMMPFIDSLKVDYFNKVKIVKVNVDASKKLVKELQIVGVPYLTFYHNNKQLYSKRGVATKNELIELFEEVIAEN